MRIIISGDGEVGFFLAKMLSNENHDITIIDPNIESIKKLEDENNILAIHGDPLSIDILNQYNIKKTDLFIAVVHDERTNILAASLAKQLGAKKTIARITNTEYLSPENCIYFRNMGIDELVCPERLAADEIVSLLKQPGAIETFTFSHEELKIVLLRIPKSSPFANNCIEDIAKNIPELSLRFIAIHRNHDTIIPRGRDYILAGDLVYILTNAIETEKLLKISGIDLFDVNSTFIIGGGRIGTKTALKIESGMNVKIFDKDLIKANKLSENLSKALVINGDARDIQLLEDENINNTDALVALTENSETNILLCLIAQRYGVKQLIALIDDVDFIDIAQNVGVDTVINKKLITAGYIARFTTKANIETMKWLYGVDAEVMEFIATNKSKITKKPIKKLKFPSGAIIGGLVRDNKAIIATSDVQIQEGDHVIIFAVSSAYKKVQDYFI